MIILFFFDNTFYNFFKFNFLINFKIFFSKKTVIIKNFQKK